MQTQSATDIFGPVISSYTRAQALADGYLVDAGPTAREAGFKFPVAITRAVWDQFVEVPNGIRGQDQDGRLWDVLYMLRYAIKKEPGSCNEIRFSVLIRNHNGELRINADLVRLKALIGPGDNGAPVMTILLPNED